MVDITADNMQALMNLSDSDISNTNMEYVIDCAINKLNTYGSGDLPNMTGTVASKTVSVESREAGAIQEATRLVYYGYYKGQETTAISSLSVSMTSMLNNPMVESTIEKLAKQLLEIEADVG